MSGVSSVRADAMPRHGKKQKHCNAPQGIEVTHSIQKRDIYLEPEKQQLVAFYLLRRLLAI